jgi:nucleoid-associated protein YgaU
VILVPDVKTALVSRGDSLWRISKRIYGQGVRYTVIYQANQIQIRNPSLIYPGQIFVVPGERL